MPTVSLTASGVFAGYTLDEIRSLILRYLRVTDTSRYSSDSTTTNYDWIDDSINRAQDAFVRMTRCLRSYAVIQIVSNNRLYRLPDDFLDWMAAYYYDSSIADGYQKLVLNSIEELNDEVSDWRVAVGTPRRAYIDRSYGAGILFGLYPIPRNDGFEITMNSNNGVLVTWVCPLYTLNQDYGVVINATGTDEYVLSTQQGVTVELTPSDGNVVIEYYRLPNQLVAQGSDAIIKSDIPREYQRAIAYFATYDLLLNNPNDSVEYKRAADMKGLFDKEVDTYINRRKRPLSGRQLRARPAVWNWQQNMTYYQNLP